jgi:hypothetical protein
MFGNHSVGDFGNGDCALVVPAFVAVVFICTDVGAAGTAVALIEVGEEFGAIEEKFWVCIKPSFSNSKDWEEPLRLSVTE